MRLKIENCCFITRNAILVAKQWLIFGKKLIFLVVAVSTDIERIKQSIVQKAGINCGPSREHKNNLYVT